MKAKTAECIATGATIRFTRRDQTEWRLGLWDAGMQRFRVSRIDKPSESGWIARDCIVWTATA